MTSRLLPSSTASSTAASTASSTALLGGVVLLVAGLLALLPARAAQADPAFQQPAIGTCWSYPLSSLDALSEDSAAVSCAGPHTAVTVDVLAPPAGLSAARAARKILPACYGSMKKVLGGNQKRIARSGYTLTVFGPNAAQRAQGATWLRCDLVLPGGKRLEQLPTPLLPSSGKIPASVERCAADGGRRLTVCSRPHTQRAGKVVVGRGKAYPGKAALVRRAGCGRGATLYYPTKVQWVAGLKAGVCLVPKRKG